MNNAVPALPPGFVVRLRDGARLGSHLVLGTRVLRLSPVARELLAGRELTVDSATTAMLAGRLLDLDLADPVLGPNADVREDVTVVVPVRDNPTGVARLLSRLPGLRCIVVDDASHDPQGLAKVVADHGGELVRLDQNVGPAAARDAGLRFVTTRLVAFVDSDVTIAAGDAAALAGHFVDPALAAVAPRVLTTSAGRWFQRYEAVCGSLDLGAATATVRARSAVTYVPSACLVARTDLLGSGFDVRLRSGEDVDLVWRLQADGHRVRHAADVVVEHAPRTTVLAWLGRKVFYGTSAADLSPRHPGRVAPAVLSPAVATAAVGVLLQRRWSVALASLAVARFVRETDPSDADLSPRERAQVVVSSAGVMTAQVAGLTLRHWWPASAAFCVVSSRARRAVAVIAVAEGLMMHRRAQTDLDPMRFTVARRLDDLAYGSGVWWGAARRRSVSCLLPQWAFPTVAGNNR